MRRLRAGDADRRRLQLAVAHREGPAQLHAGDEREVVQARAAARSAAHSRRAGRRSSIRSAVPRRPAAWRAITWRLRSTSVSSTATSVCPALPAEAGGRAARPRGCVGVSGVGANGSLAAGHGCTGLPAKKALTAFEAQPLRSLPSTEWPVKGTTIELRVGDQRGDAPRVRGRRAQVLCAGEDQRRHVRQRLLAGGGGEASGQPAQSSNEARCRAPWSCRTGRSRRRAARAGRRALRQSASGLRRCAATGTAPPRTWSSKNSASSIPGSGRPRCAPSARSGSVPRRAPAGAAAGRGRGRSAERIAAGSSARSAGFRSPASSTSSRPSWSIAAAWRRPRPS